MIPVNVKGSGGSHESRKGYGDPFQMLSNDSFPRDYVSSLDFASFIYYMNGIYQEASKRVVAHFITEIAFEEDGGDTEEQKNHREMLVDQLDIFQAMQSLGEDHAAYGVSIHRIHFPFHRYLVDKRNGKTKLYNINVFPRESIKFNVKNCTYSVPDPKLAGQFKDNWTKAPIVEMEIKDMFVKDRDRIRLVPLDPRFCRFEYGMTSKAMRVVYQFDPEHIQAIKSGDLFQIGETHEDILRAICSDKDFRFEEDSVFVFTNPTITGISKKGIGIPKPISHYRELYQLQLYRKIDEMVARDYMLPIRLFSPKFGSGGGGDFDPSMTMQGSEWRQAMTTLIRKHRFEGDTIFALPYGTEYQEANASGKQLSPKDLMELQVTTLLNSLGYPAELFNGTLAYETIPTALRLFERTQHFIPHNLNKYLSWVNKKVCNFLRIQDYKLRLQPPRIADDIEKNSILMQLVQMGEVPREELWTRLGMRTPKDAFRQRTREDSDFEEIRQEASSELERKLGPNPMQGGGTPTGPDGEQQGGSPLDMEAKAMEKAQQWSQMDEGSRRQDMDAIRNGDPQLHALAMQYLDQIRQKGETEGRNQVVNPQ